ncbi:MAG TPA: hypothetical protein VKA91_07625 [Nitrososphaeraceae archaeon]|nr:hypothetical protein [Nitrososphaeraceae archaeon]
MVLQGGGSLGADEVRAYKAIYEWLKEKEKSKVEPLTLLWVHQ